MKDRCMLWHIVLIIVSLLVAVCGAVAQELETKKSFEGVLEVQVQNTERVQLYTFSLKNGRIRVEPSEVSDALQVIIVDHPARKSYVLLPAREQYVELNYPADPGRGQNGLQKSDQADEIQGYSCDQFVLKSAQAEIEVWATKELGTAGTMFTTVAVQTLETPPWQAELFGMGYFPMKVILRDPSGYDAGKFEVNSVQKKNLGDFLFRIPRGYEKVDKDVLDVKPAPSKKKRTR